MAFKGPQAWYNENNPVLADWLENLIKGGEIAPGFVDRRSIWDVKPRDLEGYRQHHFFAGVGIWSYALRQAGWDDSVPVATVSCPCQPFSAAGKGKGFADERHLWPAFFHQLVCARFPVVFGEQVASADGLTWFDRVYSDMEGEGYTTAAVDICAAGFGAPHRRQRLYFVADTYDSERRAAFTGRNFLHRPPPRWEEGNGQPAQRGPTNGFWAGAEWRDRGDGALVGLEPGTLPVAHVYPSTMVQLHAYGNAIVAEQAIEFVRAYTEYHEHRSKIDDDEIPF